MSKHLRKATIGELSAIWNILQQAIARRKADGSNQWQNGYPNEKILQSDFDKGYAHVLAENKKVLAYAAVIFDKEAAYASIKGKWLTQQDYLVVHRVAVSDEAKGRGIATALFMLLEDLCKKKNVFSIKVDTNFDNVPMLHILQKLGYSYCGEVLYNGSPRMAFEKVLQ